MTERNASRADSEDRTRYGRILAKYSCDGSVQSIFGGIVSSSSTIYTHACIFLSPGYRAQGEAKSRCLCFTYRRPHAAKLRHNSPKLSECVTDVIEHHVERSMSNIR